MPFAVPFADRVNLLLRHLPTETDSFAGHAPSPKIQEAVQKALDRGETHYTDRPGILPLREAVAGLTGRRFGLKTDAKDVIITCGVAEARFIAAQKVLEPCEAMAAPLWKQRMQGAAILRRARFTHVRDAMAIYITSNTAEELIRSYIDAAPHDAFILYEIDEEESWFHPAQLPGCEQRTVTLGSLGEESWRAGYLISPGDYATGLRDFKQVLTICTTNLSQWAALAALEPE
jgi:aminotransferase